MSEDGGFQGVVEDVDDGEGLFRCYAPLMIALGIVGLIGGMVLLFWPKAGLAVIAVSLGTFLVVDGAERLITLLRFPAQPRRSEVLGFTGVFLRLIFGLLIVLRPVESGGVWISLIFVLAGLNLIVGCLVSLLANRAVPADPAPLAVRLGMLILGLLMILLPMVTALILLRLLGAVMILSAVPSIRLGIRSR